MKKTCLFALCTLIVLSLLQVPTQASPAEKIKIAGQFGLVYAPLMVARTHGIFEKYGVEPVWKEYGSGGAVREALISAKRMLALWVSRRF